MSADADIWRPPAATVPVRATGRGAAARISSAPEGRGESGHADRPAQYRRARNGLAMHTDPQLGWWRRRVLRNPYLWLTLVLTIGYAVLLFAVYRTIGNGLIEEVAAVTEEAYGRPTTLTWSQLNEAYWLVTRMAAATLGVYLVILVFIDRLRPTTWTMKWLALGWGAAVAVFISLHINSWAGDLMRAEGPVDPAQGARAAIFSAPFVEEAAKATVLFGLAILMRRRIVGVHQMLTLSSLSALGFAFTENIVYYLRIYMYSVTIYQTDAEAELSGLVFMRGVATSFGHPLFTGLTALGLIVALANRSKLVRVLAPVTGYLAAAFGHMLFNGIASISDNSMILIIGGWLAVLALVIYTIFRYVHQSRNIRARLGEYVQLGWLSESDPNEFSRIFGRWRMALSALLRGPRVFRATLRLQRSLTELAYVRDAELRGTVDAMAIERERELILAAGESRIWAIDHTAGVPVIPPEWGEWRRAFWQRRRDAFAERRARRQSVPKWAPPSGVPVGTGAGSWPPPAR
ncbi:MAG: PrsW family intramembrane metalloprotease [Acidobacteriota bacterium]|nr:PrsW family intramembrane metalloprotease [Acidobacteriota bacterium]